MDSAAQQAVKDSIKQVGRSVGRSVGGPVIQSASCLCLLSLTVCVVSAAAESCRGPSFHCPSLSLLASLPLPPLSPRAACSYTRTHPQVLVHFFERLEEVPLVAQYRKEACGPLLALREDDVPTRLTRESTRTRHFDVGTMQPRSRSIRRWANGGF